MAAAANRLNDKHSKSRVIVLLTDGENNAGKIPPNTAAEAIKALKIHFYAIGAGINGIAPTPVFNPQNGKPITDMFGNILYQNQRVQFNEAGLKEVAKIADGQFYRATDTKSLEQIFSDIDKLEKTTVSVKKYQQYRDLFPVCIVAGAGPAARAASPVANRLEETAVMNFGAPHWFWALLADPAADPALRPGGADARPCACANSFPRACCRSLARTVDRRRRIFRFALTLARRSLSPSRRWPNRAGVTPTKM